MEDLSFCAQTKAFGLRPLDEESSSIPRWVSLDMACRRGHLPVKLFIIMNLLLHNFKPSQTVDVVDAFSGKGGISWAFQRRNMRIARLDIALSEKDDSRMHCV